MPFDGISFASPRSLEQLDAVIDRLASPDKWCKGALHSHDGRYCIRGAIQAVGGIDELEPVVLRAIGEVAGKRFGRIEAFNDHPSTTHAQILAVLTLARDDIAAGKRVTANPQQPDQPATSRLGALRQALRGWFG